MENEIPPCEKCKRELKKCLVCKQEFKKCLKCEKQFGGSLKCLKCGEKLTEKYFWDRIIILFILIFEIVLFFFNTYYGWGLIFQIDQYLFGILAGIFGLFLRNLFWLFGNKLESSGKNVLRTYLLNYQIFIVLSSIFISSILILILNDKIKDSPYLFFTFVLPLNIYVGLEVYNALTFIKGMFGKNSE